MSSFLFWYDSGTSRAGRNSKSPLNSDFYAKNCFLGYLPFLPASSTSSLFYYFSISFYFELSHTPLLSWFSLQLSLLKPIYTFNIDIFSPKYCTRCTHLIMYLRLHCKPWWVKNTLPVLLCIFCVFITQSSFFKIIKKGLLCPIGRKGPSFHQICQQINLGDHMLDNKFAVHGLCNQGTAVFFKKFREIWKRGIDGKFLVFGVANCINHTESTYYGNIQEDVPETFAQFRTCTWQRLRFQSSWHGHWLLLHASYPG